MLRVPEQRHLIDTGALNLGKTWLTASSLAKHCLQSIMTVYEELFALACWPLSILYPRTASDNQYLKF